MPEEKTIAELIHDRVFAEGGTLVRWYGGAMFKRIEAKLTPRMSSHRTWDEAEAVREFAKFEPSEDLRKMIARNADEVRCYLERCRSEWCKECEVENVRR